MTAQDLLGIALIAFVVIWFYLKIRKQNMNETVEEIKELIEKV